MRSGQLNCRLLDFAAKLDPSIGDSEAKLK